MDIKVYRTVLKLSEQFENENLLTSSEFVAKYENLNENTIYFFLDLQRHAKIFDDVLQDFVKLNKIICEINRSKFKVLIYILLLILDDENVDDISDVFLHVRKLNYITDLLSFLLSQENQVRIAHISCKYLDNEYVIDNIVNPLLDNQQNFWKILERTQNESNKQHKKNVTVPISTDLIYHKNKRPPPPPNTPAELNTFKSTKAPKSTHFKDKILKQKLEDEYSNNKIRAETLLKNSKGLSAKIPSKIASPDTDVPPTRPKRIFVPKNVPIKYNYTTIMRQAQQYAKEKEKCIREIDEIIKGGIDTKLTETVEKETQRQIQRELAIGMEKNRLKSLLSHEEAALAKSRTLELNKIKADQLKDERKELLKMLEDLKAEERDKNVVLVEKAQEIGKNAKEAEKRLLEKRQGDARLLQWETKQLMEKAAKEKEEEMAKKIACIHEIKALNLVMSSNKKTFDKTEGSNLGFLNEMSIAELEERLKQMKKEMSEELKKKRKCIRAVKDKKERLLAEAKYFVNHHKIFKRPKSKKKMIACNENEEILQLKLKLEKAKADRKKYDLCSCRKCFDIVK